MENKLKEYGLNIRESDSIDRDNIDFSIEDKEDNVAWAWGDTFDDVEWECNHAYVDYDENELVGECVLCGATCDCHREADTGNVEDYYWSGQRLVPHEWYAPTKVGGLISEYIEELKEK